VSNKTFYSSTNLLLTTTFVDNLNPKIRQQNLSINYNLSTNSFLYKYYFTYDFFFHFLIMNA